MKLKQYGGESAMFELGYTLPSLVGLLETLSYEEALTLSERCTGPKWKRQDLVDDALAKLNEAMEMGKEGE